MADGPPYRDRHNHQRHRPAECRSSRRDAPRDVRLGDREPRRFCTEISSCEEARWYLANCSWGSKLDRDSDGIPCEGVC
ncbi:excalibur calcium-binding domain-containing protein [Mesorhizobium sp. M0601]|uniref:excalibur calcium-binding domain-containing protein n=1 Tax=Mesorhizobium sp. M0601 TaxID=2956969 RepID=UPI0033363EB9